MTPTPKASVAASEAGRVGKTTAASAYARVQKIDMDLHDAIGMAEPDGPLRKRLEVMHSDVHDLAVDVAALRDERAVPDQPTLVDMEVRVGGAYRMPDGRSFWIDGATAREIAKRALGLSPSSNDRLGGGSHDR